MMSQILNNRKKSPVLRAFQKRFPPHSSYQWKNVVVAFGNFFDPLLPQPRKSHFPVFKPRGQG